MNLPLLRNLPYLKIHKNHFLTCVYEIYDGSNAYKRRKTKQDHMLEQFRWRNITFTIIFYEFDFIKISLKQKRNKLQALNVNN